MRGIVRRLVATQLSEVGEFFRASRALSKADVRTRCRQSRLSPICLAVVALAVAFGWPSERAAAQMALPGTFEVSDAGAANYTIPIAVPPGTAGMQPALSLTYSSQNGNGMFGVGW